MRRLQQSEARYRSLVEALPDLLFRIRRDGTYLDCKVPHDLGIDMPTRQEIVGKTIAQVVPPHVAQQAMPAIERVFATGQMQTLEYQIEERTGIHHYEARFVACAKDEVLALVRDITARKQAEAALRDSQETALALLNAPSDSALLIDRNLTILAINEVGARRVNASPDSLIGTCALDYLPPAVVDERKAQLERVFETGQPLSSEGARDGRQFINTFVPVRDADGRITRLAIFAQDVTQQKQTENMLHRQRRLLEGVAQATYRLLVAPDCLAAMDEILTILGEAAQVDGITVFESHPHPSTGEPLISQRYEWVRPGRKPWMSDPGSQGYPWNRKGFGRWHAALLAGQAASGIVSQLPDDERLALEAAGVRSLLVVPIFVQDAFWGLISFDDCHTEREWSVEETSALQTMAASLGAAIESQRAAEQLHHSLNIAETLRDTAMALTSTLDLSEVLRHLLEHARHLIPYDAASAWLVEGPLARTVGLVHCQAPGQPFRRNVPRMFTVDESPLLRRMAETRQPYLSADVQSDPNWLRMPGSEWIRGWLGAPIVVRDRLVGFFTFDSATVGQFNAEHVELIAPIARQAAAACENATLFAEVRALERLKSEMIRIASHDLRGPLARIEGLLEQFEDHASVELLAPHQHTLAQIRAATHDMQRMIADILSLERIEARHRQLEPVAIAVLIERAVAALRDDLEARNHALSVECAPDLPLVRGDPVQLEHAICNLLHNAIKYTPNGGCIVVRAMIRHYGSEPTLAIEVEDNGIGIPADQHARLFEPFYRADQGSSQAQEGIGMGLAVVKMAVDYHHGRVYVDSAPGVGSLFGFWIPIVTS